MRFLFVGLLLSASAALGQTTSVAFTATGNIINTDDEIAVSRDQCTTPRTVTWTLTGNLCDTLYIWLSKDACTGIPGTDDRQLATRSRSDTATTGTVDIVVSEILERTGSSCAAEEELEFNLCATTREFDSGINGGCDDTASDISNRDIVVVYDAKPPEAPQAPVVSGLDGALSVRVTPPAGASTMRVVVQQVTADADGGSVVTGEPIESDAQSTDNTTFRVAGLQNGVEYSVRARAIDRAGNNSGLSAEARGTPIASSGFFDAYVNAGGSEMGGCGAAGGSLAGSAALVVLGLWLSRRKRS